MPESHEIRYECDGRRLVGRLAIPDGDGPFAGVLIAHEGPGHDEWQLARADRLAEDGYVAFALDYHGDLTPFADHDQMVADEMRAGGIDWQIHLYGNVGHSFTHPMVDEFGLPGLAYDQAADAHSWQSMLNLFAETLARP